MRFLNDSLQGAIVALFLVICVIGRASFSKDINQVFSREQFVIGILTKLQMMYE